MRAFLLSRPRPADESRNDGPGRGLGEGGERLHYWVFGPWSYEEEPTGEATGADREFLDGAVARGGAVVGGRNTYEAAEAWSGRNPFGMPFFIVTHRPEAAGGKDVFVMGGADVIRQALRARPRPAVAFATHITYRVAS